MTTDHLEPLRRLGRPIPLCRPDGAKCSAAWHNHPPDSNGKAPIWKGWQGEDGDWPDFPHNVGVVMGNGKAGLDIDPRNGGEATVAALEAKHGKLPVTPTALTGGGGVHLYFLADPEQKSYKMLGGIEMQASGKQLVAPGSLHRSGGEYKWAPGLSPDEVPFAKLPAWLVTDPSRSAVPVRQVPAHPAAPPASNEEAEAALQDSFKKILVAGEGGGSRHDAIYVASNRMGRYVAAGSITPARVAETLAQAAAIVGKDAGEVKRTVGDGLKDTANKPASGWKEDRLLYLANCNRFLWMERGMVNGTRDYSTYIPAAAAALLRNAGVGAKSAASVVNKTRCPVALRLSVVASPERMVRVSDGWVFNCNPHMIPEPAAGSWEDVAALLHSLASGRQEVIDWLLNWAAYGTQNPDARPGTAAVLYGDQGDGKTMLGKMFGFCRGAWTEIGQRDIKSKYNAHWAESRFIVASEIMLGDDRPLDSQQLKAWLTDETLHSEQKFAPIVDVTNRLQWWITSNNTNPVQVEHSDRRYTIIRTGRPEPGPMTRIQAAFDEYAGRLHEWPQLRALRYELLTRAVDAAAARKILETEERAAAKAVNANSVDAFVAAIDSEGFLAIRKLAGGAEGHCDEATEEVETQLLYDVYRSFCQRRGYRGEVKFEGFIHRLPWPGMNPGNSRPRCRVGVPFKGEP